MLLKKISPIIENQDRAWNFLSKNAQIRIKNEYKIITSTTPVDGFPLFESIHLMEDKYGKHNLITKVYNTWDDVEKYDSTKIEISLSNLSIRNKAKNKALATIKLYKLIELGYGGVVNLSDWVDTSIDKFIIVYDFEKSSFEIIKVKNHLITDIAFYTKKQAEKFLSFNENKTLLKEYFML